MSGPTIIIDKITKPADGQLITFVNPFTYGTLRKRPDLVDHMSAIYIDGWLMVYLFRFLGYPLTRKSFDMGSLAETVLADSERHQRKIALVGSQTGISQRAAEVLKTRFLQLQICHTAPGYFPDAGARERIIKEIIASGAEVVIVGMGVGHQEQMLVDLHRAGFKGTAYTCGGFLHQTAAGKAYYYPTWVNKYGLRWIYRSVREPKVVWRIVRHYPVNILLVFKDYFAWRNIR